MSELKKTRVVAVGGKGKTKRLLLGGNNPVVIQTMWKQGIQSILNDRESLLSLQKNIHQLEQLGCGMLRFAVPDMQSADALIKIAETVSMPLVADIHFDYQLALRCLDGNIAKIRINPGNIGSKERTKVVLQKAKDAGVPIRIGINAGSLPHDLALQVNQKKITRSFALAETALREILIFDENNFTDYVVSLKASGVRETIEANESFASCSDVPLHIGVTEAGPVICGTVKSALACSHLLKKGIGSTIRVSLSSCVEDEVIAAREILRESRILGGVEIVSCPRCGRNGFDVLSFVQKWQHELYALNKNITVAIMGCVVNGPGEAKHADIGITGAGNEVLIFKKGAIVHTVSTQNADDVFRKELASL